MSISNPVSPSAIYDPSGREMINSRGEEVIPVKTNSFWNRHKVTILTGLAVVAVLSSPALAFVSIVAATASLALGVLGLLAACFLLRGEDKATPKIVTVEKKFKQSCAQTPISIPLPRPESVVADGHLFQRPESVSMREADRRQVQALSGAWTSRKTCFVPIMPKIIGVKQGQMPSCSVKRPDHPRSVVNRNRNPGVFVFPNQPNQGPDFDYRVRLWAGGNRD